MPIGVVNANQVESSKWVANVFNSSAVNVAVSKVGNMFFLNDDEKEVYTPCEQYVPKFVTLLVYINLVPFFISNI